MKIKVSKITIAIGVFIIISASFARQLMNLIKAFIGDQGFMILTKAMILILGLAVFLFIIRNRFGLIKTAVFITVLIMGLVLTWLFIKIPEEKMHILEYAFLGWLAAKDLAKLNSKPLAAVLASLFVAAVGVLDELFQAVLPYRFYQLSDIVLNGLGGIFGTCLYMLS